MRTDKLGARLETYLMAWRDDLGGYIRTAPLHARDAGIERAQAEVNAKIAQGVATVMTKAVVIVGQAATVLGKSIDSTNETLARVGAEISLRGQALEKRIEKASAQATFIGRVMILLTAAIAGSAVVQAIALFS